LFSESSTGFSTKCEANGLMRFGERSCGTRMGSGQFREPFAEDGAWTMRLIAEEPSSSDPKQDAVAVDGLVGERS
jgi:hypothetical protein